MIPSRESTGGAVITDAGNHDKVAGLAYIAPFAPGRAAVFRVCTRGGIL
jgi:hypothetical protein